MIWFHIYLQFVLIFLRLLLRNVKSVKTMKSLKLLDFSRNSLKNNIAFIIWTNRGQANETNKTSVKKVMLIIYERNEINYTHTIRKFLEGAPIVLLSLSHTIDNIFLHAHDSISWRTFLSFFISSLILYIVFFFHFIRTVEHKSFYSFVRNYRFDE